MRHLKISLDQETSLDAGAGAHFQVVSLEDQHDNDLTEVIDQGRHYASLEDVKADIAAALRVPADEIDLEVV